MQLVGQICTKALSRIDDQTKHVFVERAAQIFELYGLHQEAHGALTPGHTPSLPWRASNAG